MEGVPPPTQMTDPDDSESDGTLQSSSGESSDEESDEDSDNGASSGTCIWDKLLLDNAAFVVASSPPTMNAPIAEAPRTSARSLARDLRRDAPTDELKMVDMILGNFERQVAVLPVGWELALHIGESDENP